MQIERQRGHADSRAGMRADLFTENSQDHIGETIDDCWLPGKIWCRVDHAEYSEPGCYTIQVTQLTFEAAQDGQGGQPCCFVSLFGRNLHSDFAEWSGKGAVRQLWSMAGDEGPVTAYAHKKKR